MAHAPTLSQGDSLGSSQMLRKPMGGAPPNPIPTLWLLVDTPHGKEEYHQADIPEPTSPTPDDTAVIPPLGTRVPTGLQAIPSRNQGVTGVVSTQPWS